LKTRRAARMKNPCLSSKVSRSCLKFGHNKRDCMTFLDTKSRYLKIWSQKWCTNVLFFRNWWVYNSYPCPCLRQVSLMSTKLPINPISISEFLIQVEKIIMARNISYQAYSNQDFSNEQRPILKLTSYSPNKCSSIQRIYLTEKYFPYNMLTTVCVDVCNKVLFL